MRLIGLAVVLTLGLTPPTALSCERRSIDGATQV